MTENGKTIDVEVNPRKFENGEIFDADSGDQLGILTDNIEANKIIPLTTIPAALEIFLNGHWYVFKMTERYKEDDSISGIEIVEPSVDPLKDL